MLSLCELLCVPLRAEFMKSHVDKPGEPGHTGTGTVQKHRAEPGHTRGYFRNRMTVCYKMTGIRTVRKFEHKFRMKKL